MVALDALRLRAPGLVRECLRLVCGWRRGLFHAPDRTRWARSFITPEEFQEELIVLGLSDRKFGPEEYVSALSAFLEISVSVHIIRDAHHPELARRLALSGRMGEVRYSNDLRLAAVLVPESLPPLVFDLTVFHELGHLAAGDLLTQHIPEGATAPDKDLPAGLLPTTPVHQGKRLARGLPFATESDREHEANLRASYAFVAGCLGEENPYMHRMYHVL